MGHFLTDHITFISFALSLYGDSFKGTTGFTLICESSMISDPSVHHAHWLAQVTVWTARKKTWVVCSTHSVLEYKHFCTKLFPWYPSDIDMCTGLHLNKRRSLGKSGHIQHQRDSWIILYSQLHCLQHNLYSITHALCHTAILLWLLVTTEFSHFIIRKQYDYIHFNAVQCSSAEHCFVCTNY